MPIPGTTNLLLKTQVDILLEAYSITSGDISHRVHLQMTPNTIDGTKSRTQQCAILDQNIHYSFVPEAERLRVLGLSITKCDIVGRYELPKHSDPRGGYQKAVRFEIKM